MYNNNNSIAAQTEYLTSPATVVTTVGTYIIILIGKIFIICYCKAGTELVRKDGKELINGNWSS